MENELKIFGGNESYFTRKLEVYLRAKGISYHIIKFDIKKNISGSG